MKDQIISKISAETMTTIHDHATKKPVKKVLPTGASLEACEDKAGHAYIKLQDSHGNEVTLRYDNEFDQLIRYLRAIEEKNM